jgi:hypothetical protein
MKSWVEGGIAESRVGGRGRGMTRCRVSGEGRVVARIGLSAVLGSTCN